MKNVLIIFCLFCSISAFAQDKITMTDGKVVEVILISVDDEFAVIRYPKEKEGKSYSIPMKIIESIETDPQKGVKNSFLPNYNTIEPVEREIYCQVIATGITIFVANKKNQIRIDYGFHGKMEANVDKVFLQSVDDGRAFTSIADALNYMSLEKGWTLISSHSSNIESKNLQYFIMKKTVVLTPEKEETN